VSKTTLHGGETIIGTTIVFTGTLAHMTREEATLYAEAHGINVARNVSRKIDYLIAGDNPGSKVTKAEALSIPVLSEDEWLRILQRMEQELKNG
jgi:DNA ligase (NAD+)